MITKSKTKILEELVEKTLADTPFEIVLTEYKKVGGEWLLRVFIDHPEGVNLDHCQTVSRLLLDTLEQNDPVDQEYLIEVSSPGVDRPLVKLTHFQRFLKERVYVKTHKPIEGQKTFTGRLLGCSAETLDVENESDRKLYHIPLEDVAKATLKPILKFD